MNKNKKTISIVSYIVGIVLLLFLTSLLLDMSKEEVTKLKYYEVLEMFENDQIESYTLDLGTGALEAQVKDQKEKLIYTVPNVSEIPAPARTKSPQPMRMLRAVRKKKRNWRKS